MVTTAERIAIVSILFLALAGFGLCPIVVLPVADLLIFAERISPIVPLFTARGKIWNAILLVMLFDCWQDLSVEIINCLIVGHDVVQVASHRMLSFSKFLYTLSQILRRLSSFFFRFFNLFLTFLTVIFLTIGWISIPVITDSSELYIAALDINCCRLWLEWLRDCQPLLMPWQT